MKYHLSYDTWEGLQTWSNGAKERETRMPLNYSSIITYIKKKKKVGVVSDFSKSRTAGTGKEASNVQQNISKINQQRQTPLQTQNLRHIYKI